MLQARLELRIISETLPRGVPGRVDESSFKRLQRATMGEGNGRCQSLIILAEVGGSDWKISIWPPVLPAELSDNITTVLSQ